MATARSARSDRRTAAWLAAVAALACRSTTATSRRPRDPGLGRLCSTRADARVDRACIFLGRDGRPTATSRSARRSSRCRSSRSPTRSSARSGPTLARSDRARRRGYLDTREPRDLLRQRLCADRLGRAARRVLPVRARSRREPALRAARRALPARAPTSRRTRSTSSSTRARRSRSSPASPRSTRGGAPDGWCGSPRACSRRRACCSSACPRRLRARRSRGISRGRS